MVETQLCSYELGIGNLCISWISATVITGKTQAGRSSQPCSPKGLHEGTAHVPSCALVGLARVKWLPSTSTAGSHQLQSRADEFHCPFVFSSFTVLLCSSFCHGEKLSPLVQQQAALSLGSCSESSGHLGISRHYYKINERADASG